MSLKTDVGQGIQKNTRVEKIILEKVWHKWDTTNLYILYSNTSGILEGMNFLCKMM